MENYITDNEYIELCDTTSTLPTQCLEYNKRLVARFPFLIPHNRWTDEVSKEYDYSYTELDAMPTAWRKAFGIKMCEEIEEELEKFNYQDRYRIMQIKEKYGSLRWYDNGVPKDSKIDDIIAKYENLSETICFYCGGKAEYVTRGWITYLCKDCFMKHISNCSQEDQKNLLLQCLISEEDNEPI